MPRTLNPVAHAIRRDAFLDAAEQLIRTKGYDQMTVQDVLDELDASKGAFYHYFDSRQALLAAVVERMTDTVLAYLEPIATDRVRSAPAKLQAFFSMAVQWKSERSELLLGFMRSWYSEENDLVRLRVARDAYGRITPVLAAILRQGTAEGAFDLTSADDAAAMLMALSIGSTDAVGRLALDCLDGRVPVDHLERYLSAYNEAIERILGLRAGVIVFIDPRSMRAWFT
jgi:AcrR family transcriptional regulator